jgi:hypothetical protein
MGKRFGRCSRGHHRHRPSSLSSKCTWLRAPSPTPWCLGAQTRRAAGQKIWDRREGWTHKLADRRLNLPNGAGARGRRRRLPEGRAAATFRPPQQPTGFAPPLLQVAGASPPPSFSRILSPPPLANKRSHDWGTFSPRACDDVDLGFSPAPRARRRKKMTRMSGRGCLRPVARTHNWSHKSLARLDKQKVIK